MRINIKSRAVARAVSDTEKSLKSSSSLGISFPVFNMNVY